MKVPKKYKEKLKNKLKKKKEKIKSKFGFSPDDGDALVLTFAEPVSMTTFKPIQFASEF